MNAFAYLLLGHLILDYPMQGEFLGLGKSKYYFLLLVHCLMWALGMCAVLTWLGIYSPWMFWWMFIGHIWMDWLKCRDILAQWCTNTYCWWHKVDETWSYKVKQKWVEKAAPWVNESLSLPLWIDQAWHIIQLLVCLI